MTDLIARSAAGRPIDSPGGLPPMDTTRPLDVTAAWGRLLGAVEAAQAAMVGVVDAAAVYETLWPVGDIEAVGPVDPGALLAHVVVRVLAARYGPGHRLVGHLRYWRGQRFLDEPGGPLAHVPRPREHVAPQPRPP